MSLWDRFHIQTTALITQGIETVRNPMRDTQKLRGKDPTVYPPRFPLLSAVDHHRLSEKA